MKQSKELLKHCVCLLGSTMIARPTRQSFPLGTHQYVALGSKNASRVRLLAISGPSVRSGPDFRYNRIERDHRGCVYSSDRTGPTDQDIRTTYTLNTLRIRINRVGPI